MQKYSTVVHWCLLCAFRTVQKSWLTQCKHSVTTSGKNWKPFLEKVKCNKSKNFWCLKATVCKLSTTLRAFLTFHESHFQCSFLDTSLKNSCLWVKQRLHKKLLTTLQPFQWLAWSLKWSKVRSSAYELCELQGKVKRHGSTVKFWFSTAESHVWHACWVVLPLEHKKAKQSLLQFLQKFQERLLQQPNKHLHWYPA